MKNTKLKILSGLGLSLLVGSAWAGTINDIKVTSLSPDHKVIKLRFAGGTAQPKGFSTETPPRIALDFAQTDLNVPQKNLKFNDPLLQQISAVSDGKRTRIALALSKRGQYEVQEKGNEIWINLKTAGAAPVAAASSAAAPRTAEPAVTVTRGTATPVAAPAQPAVPTAPVDLRFTKNARGAGVVSLNLPAGYPEPKVTREKNRLILDFPNLAVAPNAQKVFDVTEFSTPVRQVSLRRLGNSTRVEIQTSTSWDYETKNETTQYLVTVSPQADLFNTLDETPKPKNFKGGRITLDFQDVDVRTILQILAKESGLNIVASDSVQGRMTLNLKNVPWDQALDLVMQARGLDMRRQGNIINIAPRAELLQREREVMQGIRDMNEMGQLISRTFQLKYKSVEEFKAILDSSSSGSGGSSSNQSMLSSRGSYMIDPGTNTLIVTDNQNVIDKFNRLVQQLDVPVRQVMIEARIVEANDGFSRELGVKFGATNNYSRNTIGTSLDNALANRNSWTQAAVQNYTNAMNNALSQQQGQAPSSFTAPVLPTYTLGNNISLPVSAATSSIALVHAFSSGALGLELQAMQSENRGKIISSPRVLTQDRKQATIESGREIPYQEASSSGATSTSFKKAVLGLTVTPQITPDGNVIMDVQINKDDVDPTCGATEPCISTKNLNTRAMVENGGTLIVGGIYEEQEQRGESKVPLLGDLPVIGNLFKSQVRNTSRNELLIFITPRIMDNIGGNNLYY